MWILKSKHETKQINHFEELDSDIDNRRWVDEEMIDQGFFHVMGMQDEFYFEVR